MQSSEFIKSLNFESNLKKLEKKTCNIFHLKIDFYRKKKLISNRIYSDRIELDVRIPKFPFQLEVMMKKLLKNTEIAKLTRSVLFPNNQRYRSQILMTQIKNLNKD